MPHERPAKRRRLTPPSDTNTPSETIKASELFSRAADWDLEQAYEQRLRNKRSQETTKLPIKNREGALQRIDEQQLNENDSDSFLGSESEGGEVDGLETPPTDTDTSAQIPLKEQIIATKEEVARIAELLNEDPEEHAGSFKRLDQLTIGAPVPVQKLVFAAQTAIYKDVIPGYRIRAYKDEDLSNKVSKDVRRTRQYEQALVQGYRNYVARLSSSTKKTHDASEDPTLRSVAINCVCQLLLSVPHFNFRSDLLNVLVHELASREASPDFIKCVNTLEKFFDADDDGASSLEAVSLLTKMMKAKDYRIREEVLNTFFRLRLLSELNPKGSEVESGKPGSLSKLHGKKVKKEKWEHRSKKERKVARERKTVEKDMKDAQATVDFEARERMQSETLKMVFVTYFRILKAGTPILTGAVLEGLAQFAHLINQDLFGDILEALKDIVNQAEMIQDGDETGEIHAIGDSLDQQQQTRESLLSTQTAFTLLSGQDVAKSASALHLDLSFFTSHIYRSLHELALDANIELGPKSLHLPDPHSSNAPNMAQKINISTPILLLTRIITSILLTPSRPSTTIVIASFFKRLLGTCLQLPEKSALAILGVLTTIVEKHGRKFEALWYSDERKGDGAYHGESESIEGTNVFAVGSGIWEKELLRLHYCPGVREQIKGIDKVLIGLSRQ